MFSDARISKRPLLRPPIPSPYASSASPKIVYISTKTPFISAVKRVRKLLHLIDKRAVGKVDLGDGQKGKDTLSALEGNNEPSGKEPEEVVLKATNRAIEKALGLGIFFQGQGDVRVRLRTGSVGAVDDIVVEEQTIRKKERGKQGKTAGQVEETGTDIKDHIDAVDKGLNEEQGIAEADDVMIPETQIRKVSVLEIGISLK
ncbi:MAG: hypothetical protein Q9169_002179 [Polycauliona sp. 2 TL-2023]